MMVSLLTHICVIQPHWVMMGLYSVSLRDFARSYDKTSIRLRYSTADCRLTKWPYLGFLKSSKVLNTQQKRPHRRPDEIVAANFMEDRLIKTPAFATWSHRVAARQVKTLSKQIKINALVIIVDDSVPNYKPCETVNKCGRLWSWMNSSASGILDWIYVSNLVIDGWGISCDTAPNECHWTLLMISQHWWFR